MSKETKFTKGEWAMFDERIGVIDKPDSQSYGMMNEVAFVDMYNFKKEECKANAHLIKTSPKLYAMLEFLEGFRSSMGKPAWASEITKLLAEARGE